MLNLIAHKRTHTHTQTQTCAYLDTQDKMITLSSFGLVQAAVDETHSNGITALLNTHKHSTQHTHTHRTHIHRTGTHTHTTLAGAGRRRADSGNVDPNQRSRRCVLTVIMKCHRDSESA